MSPPPPRRRSRAQRRMRWQRRWPRSKSSSVRAPIMKLGDNTAMQVDAISTGSLGLDLALGVGGVPRGRIIEVFGPESSGKTTLALHILAEAQKKGGEVAFIDVEHALDPAYASALGVNIDELLVSQPDTGEQAHGDLRGAGAFRCHRRHRRGLRGRYGAPRRDRGRDGRQPRRPAGPSDESGHAQADQRHRQDQHRLRLHQPAA